STMESEMIALAMASEEAGWLRNLLSDTPLWERPIPAVLIHCDSTAAIAKVQNHYYNGKRRQIRRKHSTIKEFLSNGAVRVDYVRFDENLADPLTKGLTREKVWKTSKGMGLKPLEGRAAKRLKESDFVRDSSQESFIASQRIFRVYRTPLHKPVEFVDAFPQALRSYIHHVKDVAVDGHCGYRAIAELLLYGEDGWVQVRRDLLNELESYSVHYSALYGSENRVYELKHSLAYFGPDANFDRWMTMLDMGHIVASCYDVVLVHLSNVQCLKFLSLRSRPLPLSDRKEIAIGFINRHFVQVFLKPSHPIPLIGTNWDRYREWWTTEWALPYITRIRQFIYITSKDDHIAMMRREVLDQYLRNRASENGVTMINGLFLKMEKSGDGEAPYILHYRV
ncbi:unnamed protein product, partial [Prunus armeniaca]